MTKRIVYCCGCGIKGHEDDFYYVMNPTDVVEKEIERFCSQGCIGRRYMVRAKVYGSTKDAQVVTGVKEWHESSLSGHTLPCSISKKLRRFSPVCLCCKGKFMEENPKGKYVLWRDVEKIIIRNGVIIKNGQNYNKKQLGKVSQYTSKQKRCLGG